MKREGQEGREDERSKRECAWADTVEGAEITEDGRWAKCHSTLDVLSSFTRMRGWGKEKARRGM